jgi:triphosphatase
LAAWQAPGDLRRCLSRLKTAQELLGHYHDLAVAEQAFRALAAQDGRAWFAVGWLQARREQTVEPAGKALGKVVAAAELLRTARRRRSKRALPQPP